MTLAFLSFLPNDEDLFNFMGVLVLIEFFAVPQVLIDMEMVGVPFMALLCLNRVVLMMDPFWGHVNLCIDLLLLLLLYFLEEHLSTIKLLFSTEIDKGLSGLRFLLFGGLMVQALRFQLHL